MCALLVLPAAGLGAADRLPARDLIVEVRLVDAIAGDEGSGADSGVTIDSRGGVHGGAAVTPLGSTERLDRAIQAVRVRNGARARIQLARAEALTSAERGMRK